MKATELAARVQAFAAARQITPHEAREILISRGLAAFEASAAGGASAAGTMSRKARRARAEAAARGRWAGAITATTITERQIAALAHEARTNGDAALERVTARALNGSVSARRRCARILAERVE